MSRLLPDGEYTMSINGVDVGVVVFETGGAHINRGRGAVQVAAHEHCAEIPWAKGQDPSKGKPDKHNKLTNRWGRRK